MPPDGPWLAPSTWRSGKNAMKNKSWCHRLSGSALLFMPGGREMIQKLFSLPPPVSLSQWVMSGLGFAGNRLTKLLYRFTGFPARFAALLLNFTCHAFCFAFGFEFGILDQFPSLVLDRARNLLALTFDLIFVPHTCLLLSVRILTQGSGYYVDYDFFNYRSG